MGMMASELDHGDRVEIGFTPAYRDEDAGLISHCRGEVFLIVGMVYVACETHRTGIGTPRVIRLDDQPGAEICLIETALEKSSRKAAARRGEIVFKTLPRDAREVEEQLEDLAGMMAQASPARRRELEYQFNDVADFVSLAKRKRTYVLKKVELGTDFHPWETRDDRVFRIETERPLPADFEIDRPRRTDRARRLEEAVWIFGEAEREVRRFASQLRAANFDVRRPHPNAQELLIRIRWDSRMRADILLSCSSNGMWKVAARAADNKTKERARRRLIREGHVERVAAFLGL